MVPSKIKMASDSQQFFEVFFMQFANYLTRGVF